MEFESAEGDLNVGEKTKHLFPDNRWYCEMDCVVRLCDTTLSLLKN